MMPFLTELCIYFRSLFPALQCWATDRSSLTGLTKQLLRILAFLLLLAILLRNLAEVVTHHGQHHSIPD
jgi:hypothetical protein